MDRPRIKRTTQRMTAPNGDLYLLRPSAGADIHIEDPDPEGMALLDALDGTRTRGELIDEFGEEEVCDLLAQLEELSVVEDACDDDRHPTLAPSGMRADVCPICGGPNECGGAMGTDQCWCSTVKISPEALAAIPADARHRICVCPRCAQRSSHGIEDTADPRGSKGK